MNKNLNINHLYPNFLKDAAIYAQAEQHWKTNIQDALKEVGATPTLWIDTSYQPWMGEFNGNPIYSAIIKGDKVIRLIQEAPSMESIKIDAWLDKTEDEEGTIRPELVIALELTSSTQTLALALIKEWAKQHTGEKEMEAFIEKTLP